MSQDLTKRDRIGGRTSGSQERPENTPPERREPRPSGGAVPTSATSAADQLGPGTVVADRYLVVRIVGSGGMGKVYRADDLILGEPVALKVLTASGGSGSYRMEQLVGEVRLARRVTHLNVCRVHDVGQADGLFFISMEYINGLNLATLIKRKGRLSSDRALEIGIQTAKGLAAIHAQGVLHLDLKPANLMLDPSTGVKITDFGIAGRIGEEARGGTAAYMPPEQQEGSACKASDLYSLGVVLYELVTGRRPFIGPAIEVACLHRDVVPMPPSAVVDNVDPRIERLILRCLEKNPALRPATAESVAKEIAAAQAPPESLNSLEAGPAGTSAAEEGYRPPLTSGRLRTWPVATLPDRPYPVLLPYTHPKLLAGRRRDLGDLQRRLRLEVPILGLHAASGIGKSSLLIGGLVPWLKAAGWPVAYTRFPWEPDLANRLLGDLLETNEGDKSIDWTQFGDAITEVARLSEDAPVLILDQAEELLIRDDARSARAVAGVLLAATMQRRPGLAGPPCRWLLVYRQEYHGDIVSWLSNVLADARTEGLSPLDGLPDSLDGADRFHAMNLEPLGATAPGSDQLEEATKVFRAAIEAPLELTTPEGDPQYPLIFTPGHAERLAEAFARCRVARPEAPLAPELQVVLAHLQGSAPAANGVVEVRVPDDAGALIGQALEDHLRRSLEAAFPQGLGGAAQRRARALLALRELAHTTGRRQEGLSTPAMVRAIGEGGEQILDRLAAPDTRLVVASEHADGLRWVLSHDRLAEAVVRLVESEGQHGGLMVDAELLALRRFISLESALHELREEAPDRLGLRRSRQIEANADVLLFDEPRRRWWRACQARQRAHAWHITVWTTVVAMVLGLVGAGAWHWASERAILRGLAEQVSEGEPGPAITAFEKLQRRPEIDAEALRKLLGRRERPLDLLERGLGDLPDETRGRVVLKAVEISLPLVESAPEDPVLVASLLWALDFGPARDPALAGEAEVLWERVLEPLRRLKPPPPAPRPEDPEWADIPGGTFWMGSGPDAASEEWSTADKRRRHQVTLSPFQLLIHEVTNADYRRLVPRHEGDDALPALITWYEAYSYAAWLGGRLPTEAEWEYAARANCPHPWCMRDGTQGAIDQVAWWIGNASVAGTSGSASRPVMALEPNPWGLYDMLGNLWEWTSDWHGEYPAKPQVNPVGASDSDYRVCRGGSVTQVAASIQAGNRGVDSPGYPAGCRVLLPAK